MGRLYVYLRRGACNPYALVFDRVFDSAWGAIARIHELARQKRAGVLRHGAL